MHVKVEHRLPTRSAIGLKQRDPIGREGLLRRLRNALCGLHHGGRFFRRELQHRDCMALAGYQYMTGIDLTNVHKGNGQFIFIDLGGRDFTCHDLAEDAVAGRGGVNKHGHGRSPEIRDAISGSIVEKQACCRQIAAWRMQGLDLVPVAFNVSPLQLADSGFPVRLTTWLQHYGVRTSDIQIEITESCLVEPAGIAARVLAQLQHMGVRIALDDFGTGFSSLSQIRNLPINTIKLDKSFVNELRTSTEAGVLVTSIITLAHNLRMQVVAEGVELKDQLVYLKTAGCDVAQGYFLSRPVAAAQAEALLRQGVVQLS
jgi:EAL domain-containing protein (putative c-di-GMP-specific phosphodiesterase class I)